MKLTTVNIKTNCHMDGFFNETLSSFGGDYFGHLSSITVEAFNKIDELIIGGQHYIDGCYIEILSITEKEV